LLIHVSRTQLQRSVAKKKKPCITRQKKKTKEARCVAAQRSKKKTKKARRVAAQRSKKKSKKARCAVA
jgi:hypothetical protein